MKRQNKIEIIKKWFEECLIYEYSLTNEEAEDLLKRLE